MLVKVYLGAEAEFLQEVLSSTAKHLLVVAEDEESQEIIAVYTHVDHSVLPLENPPGG